MKKLAFLISIFLQTTFLHAYSFHTAQTDTLLTTHQRKTIKRIQRKLSKDQKKFSPFFIDGLSVRECASLYTHSEGWMLPFIIPIRYVALKLFPLAYAFNDIQQSISYFEKKLLKCTYLPAELSNQVTIFMEQLTSIENRLIRCDTTYWELNLRFAIRSAGFIGALYGFPVAFWSFIPLI